MAGKNLKSKSRESVQQAKTQSSKLGKSDTLPETKINQQLSKIQGKVSGDVKRVLEENLKYTKAIYEDTQKIRRYMIVRTVVNFIWIIIVLAPLILAIIWLPPVFRDVIGQYQTLLGEGQNILELLNQIK